jgi:hypothetical protein
MNRRRTGAWPGRALTDAGLLVAGAFAALKWGESVIGRKSGQIIFASAIRNIEVFCN